MCGICIISTLMHVRYGYYTSTAFFQAIYPAALHLCSAFAQSQSLPCPALKKPFYVIAVLAKITSQIDT